MSETELEHLGVRLLAADSSARILFRVSEETADTATLSVYIESFMPPPEVAEGEEGAEEEGEGEGAEGEAPKLTLREQAQAVLDLSPKPDCGELVLPGAGNSRTRSEGGS